MCYRIICKWIVLTYQIFIFIQIYLFKFIISDISEINSYNLFFRSIKKFFRSFNDYQVILGFIWLVDILSFITDSEEKEDVNCIYIQVWILQFCFCYIDLFCYWIIYKIIYWIFSSCLGRDSEFYQFFMQIPLFYFHKIWIIYIHAYILYYNNICLLT